MSIPRKIFIPLIGAKSTEVELFDKKHIRLCQNKDVEKRLIANVESFAHIVHKALAGRGWLEAASIVNGEWELLIHTVKISFSWYSGNQDPYELILHNMKGQHRKLCISDKATSGHKLLLYIVHHTKLIQEARIVFDDPDDDFLSVCAGMP